MEVEVLHRIPVHVGEGQVVCEERIPAVGEGHREPQVALRLARESTVQRSDHTVTSTDHAVPVGIAPGSGAGFVAAQLVGGLIGLALVAALYPKRRPRHRWRRVPTAR